MTFSSLETFLSPEQILQSNCTWITDTFKADGNFLILHLLGVLLRERQRSVVLIASGQIFQHYQSIGRKVGLNLWEARQAGLLYFIDATTLASPFAQPSSSTQEECTEETGRRTISSQPDGWLTKLGSTVQDTLAQITTPFDLIIDDFSIFVHAGVTGLAALEFFSKLRYWNLARYKQEARFIGLLHSDSELMKDPEYLRIYRTLLQEAWLLLQVEGLESGFSLDVHGSCLILPGPKDLTTVKGNRPNRVHFKRSENGVQFFAPGLSPAVL